MPPNNNKLVAQALSAPTWPSNPQHDTRRDGLFREFARANGVVRSSEFTLHALARAGAHGGAWGEPFTWPGCDHLAFFKRARRAALVVTEPYETADLRRLHDYVAERGLALHMPPNPRASFHYPGATYFVVLTRPDFGPVTWLRDQLDFAIREPGQLRRLSEHSRQ